uniref:Uncharacterized protein n=1 Tax=Triticum urartu TaxID=4572 RepID=A0A8R7QJ90_TRIUA
SLPHSRLPRGHLLPPRLSLSLSLSLSLRSLPRRRLRSPRVAASARLAIAGTYPRRGFAVLPPPFLLSRFVLPPVPSQPPPPSYCRSPLPQPRCRLLPLSHRRPPPPFHLLEKVRWRLDPPCPQRCFR